MDKLDFKFLRGFYRKELFENFIPFWLGRGIDEKEGGFFTCFSNDGKTLIHRHKFIWSQGRFLWLLSRLHAENRDALSPMDQQKCARGARRGYAFLRDHALLENGHCSFIVSETGEPVLLNPDGTARKAGAGEYYDSSLYADFFALYGVSEYARAFKEREAFEFALKLYRSIEARLVSRQFRTDPYPVPPGYKVHGEPMIALETWQEFADTCAAFGDPLAAELRRKCGEYVRVIMEDHLQPDNVILEFIGTDNRVYSHMLGTYINPGHTLEDCWFLIHWAQRINDAALIKRVVTVAQRAMEVGWDAEFGGLPQFIHRTGGAPKGEVPPELADSEMVRKLKSNWDNKLWWPHSEALYTLLLCFERSGDPVLLDAYWKAHEYTFRIFPNPDKSIGEWIQIRDRKGNPEEKVVALPVKDPFHITRNFLHALKVLDRLIGR
ncbi:MAG: AGE family epimerase/isomerase [Fibrobacterota bacterium]